MAAVDILAAFGYKWAQDGTAEALDDAQYKTGWSFIGPIPPSVEQFNKVHQIADEKANWLYGNMYGVFATAGVTPTAGSLLALRDSLRATGLFVTAAPGTNDTKAATTAFVTAAAAALLQGFTSMQMLSTSNTFVVPAGVRRIRYRVWAGGGGGGGSASAANSGASGGGGGGYVEGIATVTPGQSIAYAVGAGGALGTAGGSPTSGGAGGASSFGAFGTANGGGGGVGANGAIQAAVGAGGAFSGGDFGFPGSPGSTAYAVAVGFILGLGGAAFSSPPGGPISAGATAAGGGGIYPGVGGGGGYLGGHGSPGIAGRIILEY